MNYIFTAISESKKYKELDKKFVKEEIEKFLRNNYMIKNELNKLEENGVNLQKNKRIKEIIKMIKKELRRKSSFYVVKKSQSEPLLKSHFSTKERYEYYGKIIERIRSFIENKKVADIGCGLNPIAMPNSFKRYYAYDINKSVINAVNEYFNKNNLKGQAIVKNALDVTGEFDTCILFKILHILDNKGHKNAERIIDNVKCKVYIISFSTKTYSGKNMNMRRRGWVERMLERKGLLFDIFETPNEIFYIAKKK